MLSITAYNFCLPFLIQNLIYFVLKIYGNNLILVFQYKKSLTVVRELWVNNPLPLFLSFCLFLFFFSFPFLFYLCLSFLFHFLVFFPFLISFLLSPHSLFPLSLSLSLFLTLSLSFSIHLSPPSLFYVCTFACVYLRVRMCVCASLYLYVSFHCCPDYVPDMKA